MGEVKPPGVAEVKGSLGAGSGPAGQGLERSERHGPAGPDPKKNLVCGALATLRATQPLLGVFQPMALTVGFQDMDPVG